MSECRKSTWQSVTHAGEWSHNTFYCFPSLCCPASPSTQLLPGITSQTNYCYLEGKTHICVYIYVYSIFPDLREPTVWCRRLTPNIITLQCAQLWLKWVSLALSRLANCLGEGGSCEWPLYGYMIYLAQAWAWPGGIIVPLSTSKPPLLGVAYKCLSASGEAGKCGVKSLVLVLEHWV